MSNFKFKKVSLLKSVPVTFSNTTAQQADKHSGCEHCLNVVPLFSANDSPHTAYIVNAKNGTGKVYLAYQHNGRTALMIKIKNCPMCGKKLEETSIGKGHRCK